VVTAAIMRLADRLTFEQYVNRFGKTDYVELVNGQVVEKPQVELDEQKCLSGFSALSGGLLKQRGQEWFLVLERPSESASMAVVFLTFSLSVTTILTLPVGRVFAVHRILSWR
jgi:hypothetical protein